MGSACPLQSSVGMEFSMVIDPHAGSLSFQMLLDLGHSQYR